MNTSHRHRPGEKVLKTFRQSYLRLYLDLLFVLIGFALLGVLFVTVSASFHIYILLILLALAILVGGAVYLTWYFTVFTVTSVRVEYVSGILTKIEEEIALEDVQTVDAAQDLVGRIFWFGDIKIESAGTNLIILKNVHKAHQLAHEISNLSLEYNKNIELLEPKDRPSH